MDVLTTALQGIDVHQDLGFLWTRETRGSRIHWDLRGLYSILSETGGGGEDVRPRGENKKSRPKKSEVLV